MNASTDQLDSETHARIFEEKIASPRLLHKASYEHPKAIILGGQPGSGKGGLARAANNELADTAVTIDPDNLRRFHPSIKEFRSADPYGWSGLTQRDAGQWAEELLHAAADGGQEAVSVDRTAGVNPPSSVECGRRPMPAAMVMGMWPRQQPVVWVHGWLNRR